MVAPTTAFEDSTADNPAWTGLSEEATFLQNVVSDSGRATITQVGTSAVDGNPINMVAVGYPSAPTQEELKTKSVVLFIAAQHGDEPSGREMALQKIRDLAYTTDATVQRYLMEHPVLFIPTPNPDNLDIARTNKLGNDLNRLWLSFSDAEVQAMGAVIRDYKPHIVVDFHEKMGGATQFEFLHPTNGEVSPDISNISQLIHAAGRSALNAAGYSTDLYSGSTDANILRNCGGLQNIITILGESSGQGDTTYLTRKQAVDGYSIFLDEVFSYHRANEAEIAEVVAVATLASRQAGEDKDVIVDPDTTPPAGYTVTNAQHSTIATSLDRLGLLSYELSDSSGYFVSMAQGNKKTLPFLVDAASNVGVVSGQPVGSDPQLLSPQATYNVRWRRDSAGEAESFPLLGAATEVDSLSLLIGGLKPDRAYEWSVQEQQVSATGAWSNWTALTTLPRFDVELRDTATQTTELFRAVEGTSQQVNDLTPNEQYEFRVREDSGEAFSDWSSWFQFTTASDTGGVLAASNLSGAGTLTGAVRKTASIAAAAMFTSSLAAAPVVDKPTSADLTGAGTLVAEASSAGDSGADLNVAGVLAADPAATRSVASSLSGAATLVAEDTYLVSVQSPLSGTGALSAAPAVSVSTSATLQGTGDLTAMASKAGDFEASLSASGTLNASPHVDVSVAGGLTGSGVLLSEPTVLRDAAGVFATSGELTGEPGVAGVVSVAADLNANGTLVAQAEMSGVEDGGSNLTGAATLQAAPSKITDLSVTLSSEGRLSGDPNVQTNGAADATASGDLQAAPSKITDLRVELVGQGELSASAVVETAQAASANLTGQSSVTADPRRDAAGVGVFNGALEVSAAPEVTRSVAADMAGQGSLSAVPARTRVGDGEFITSGTLTADAETATFKSAEAPMQGAGALAADPARTLSVGVSLVGEAILEAQGAVDQKGAADLVCEGTLRADTLGGTPVYRGYLYAKGVAIKPSMSCYTKLKPTFTGDSGVSPSVTGTVIVKPR